MLPVPIKNTEDRSIAQSLREIVRRAADATQYQKLIGPIEVVTTLLVQGLATMKDVVINRLSVLCMADFTNIDVRGSTTTERLGVARRGTIGELEVYETAYFNRDIQAATFIEMQERPDQGAPAANRSRIFTRDNGAGKTQLVVIFPTGAVQVIATEP